MSAQSRRGTAVAVALVALGVAGIAATQRHAAATHAAVKEDSEAYFLPPPDELTILSLGYRAALADVLWARVLVVQGLRLSERRRFSTLVQHLDAIITLDPTFREPYLMSDVLITLQPIAAPIEEVYRAREILELGVERHPNDARMWLQLGQFVTFIAPATYIEDEALSEQWRMEGSRYLARASELGGASSDISWLAIGGASILRRAGEVEAAIQFYERTLLVTDDDELRDDILIKLNVLRDEKGATEALARDKVLSDLWRGRYVASSRTGMMLLPPPLEPARCAGGTRAAAHGEPGCATSWKDWFDRTGAAIARDARVKWE